MNNIGGNHGLENTTHAVRLILKYALEVGGVYFGISFIWFCFTSRYNFVTLPFICGTSAVSL